MVQNYQHFEHIKRFPHRNSDGFQFFKFNSSCYIYMGKFNFMDFETMSKMRKDPQSNESTMYRTLDNTKPILSPKARPSLA